MKNINIYGYIFCSAFIVLSGCSKFLEKDPDNRASLSSPEKVSQLLATAYPNASYVVFAESISDNVGDKGTGEIVPANRDPFFFEDVKDIEEDSPEFYWAACYAAIAAANQALVVCNTAPDPERYLAQKGEALVARAYSHFMLVNFFAKFYDPNTAASDPGIPYVTEPESVVIKQYDRKTVAYVYEMIEKDLQEGLPLLDDNVYSVPKYHFNKAAAHAFAARYYLFRQEYDSVLVHTNQVAPANNFQSVLRPVNSTYLTLQYADLAGSYAKATESANLLLAETKSLWGRQFASVRYGLNNEVRNYLFSYNVTGGSWAWRVFGQSGYYNIPKINEYFVKSSVNAEIGQPYVMVPLFTAEEALFNRVEANIVLGNTTPALQDLNLYASTRIRNYNAATHAITPAKIASFYGTSNLQLGLLYTLLDFKQTEFVHEGMRWFDILRYQIPVSHVSLGPNGQVAQTMELGADSPYRVFQIPASASLSGVEGNPR